MYHWVQFVLSYQSTRAARKLLTAKLQSSDEAGTWAGTKRKYLATPCYIIYILSGGAHRRFCNLRSEVLILEKLNLRSRGKVKFF